MFGAIAGAVKMIAGIGASGIAWNGVAKLIPQNCGKIMKGVYIIGGVGLAGAAGDVAERYFDRQFKATSAAIKAAKEELEKEAEDGVIDVDPSEVKEVKEDVSDD